MLEEDGRIEEQIFNEYVQLNLRYPPQFIQVSTAEEAFETLEKENIHLIINMLSVGGMDPFELSRSLKEKYPNIPLVVLTPFSREISLKLEKEDLSAVDYVFSWLGHADLLLAIVKLIEDKNNAEYDINKIGVQCVILVEDSVPFYSSYLPNIYKIIITQAKSFMSEGLNEHQKTMRMRGRPKILFAKNYEEAVELFNKYKHNLLGIISDISYERNGERDDYAGLNLCRLVRKEDKTIPFLLQSSNKESAVYAKRLNAGFIHKNSKTLLRELKRYLMDHLAFGDFVFICPKTGKEVARAKDLKELQEKVMVVEDEVLRFHAGRDHLSKWLRARALFRIANMFRYLRPEHFNDINDLRHFIYNALSGYRKNTGRGIIAKFYRTRPDEYAMFSRMGDGYIGGKARGLAFIDLLLKQNNFHNKFENVYISIPRTVVISTDYFDEFMEKNSLYELALAVDDDDIILEEFTNAKLPVGLLKDLYRYLEIVKKPIAVRSSSLLEDSHYQPFAGIYSTFMIPYIEDIDRNLRNLAAAIKSVYASVYFKASKAYMTVTKNMIDEEKMAIVLQEVCGDTINGNLFMPTFSGVARSLNYYPIGDEKPEEGVVELAVGLGKHIVDGQGYNLRFTPNNPRKILQLSTPSLALKDTQKHFYALNIDPEVYVTNHEDFNLVRKPIKELPLTRAFKMVLSSFDFHSNMLRDTYNGEGKPIVTFSHLLKYDKIPLADIMKAVLKMGEEAMNNPVEIEFAVQIPDNPKEAVNFSLLQIRPIVESGLQQDIDIFETDPGESILISESAIGNGFIPGIRDIVYVKQENYDPSLNPEIAKIIEGINDNFGNDDFYILIGPGRWGSQDPWLGIPVSWPQISHARVIVESSLENYHVDPSQGTHFFQNLTSFHVGYLTINPHLNDGFLDTAFLNNNQQVMYEDKYVRHIRLAGDAKIMIDGKVGKAVIYKPDITGDDL
jgi:CheY-like chemotaxis protein